MAHECDLKLLLWAASLRIQHSHLEVTSVEKGHACGEQQMQREKGSVSTGDRVYLGSGLASTMMTASYLTAQGSEFLRQPHRRNSRECNCRVAPLHNREPARKTPKVIEFCSMQNFVEIAT